ncbi:MAG TPA: histidine phosphatase family protein [Anaerolineae bacterium]|nr:histidine phosphatase family protein [Anaerolineae bacterium]HOU13278.1 histidine phosphatase family protein [Anaerolineae bacterium]
MSASTHITFVRHGQVYNLERVVYGRLPGFPLSELGKRQAQAAAEALRDVPLAAVFSSPLLRAQQTARILLAERPDVPLYTSELLNEVRFFFEGQPLLAMLSRGWDLYSGVDPSYEQPPDVVARAREFLAQVRRDYAGQHVVAVSHGDVIAFTALWAFGVELIPANKHTLNLHGLSEDYPSPASLLTFSYAPEASDGRPTTITYRRPYGEDLADPGVSPK